MNTREWILECVYGQLPKVVHGPVLSSYEPFVTVVEKPQFSAEDGKFAANQLADCVQQIAARDARIQELEATIRQVLDLIQGGRQVLSKETK